jgi:translocation and assembly module TamB
LALIVSALFEKGRPLAIRLPTVSIDSIDVRLDTDDAGKLELTKALEPRSLGSSPTPKGRGVRLVMPQIVLKRATAAGHMAGAPPLNVSAYDVRGSFAQAPDVIEGSVAGARIIARDIVRGLDLDGSLQANARTSSDKSARLGARVWWRGSLGGIAHIVQASLDDDKVDAVIDVPQVSPEDLGGLWSHSAVANVAHARVEGHGTLTHVELDINAGLGPASLLGKANLAIGGEKNAKFRFVARDVDVREFDASAPRSRITISGEGSASLSAQGALAGDVAARILSGSVGAYPLPATSIRANVSRSDPNDLRARAEIDVQDPATPARLSIELSPRGTASYVNFSLDADAPDLGRVEKLRDALRGSGRVAAKGSVDVETMTVDADLEGAAEDLARASTTIKSIAVDAHASGPLASPLIDVALHSKDVVADGIRFASIDVHAQGNSSAPHIDGSAHGPDIPDTEASLDLRPGSGLSLEHIRIRMARAGEQASLAVQQLKITKTEFQVEEGRLEGLGAPATVDLALNPRALRLRASTRGIDLARVGRLAHVERKLKCGVLTLDADLDLRRDDAYGMGTLNLNRASFLGIQDVALGLQAHLDGRRFRGNAQARASGIGFLQVDARRLELGGGGALSSASWKRAWGDVSIDGRLDLEKLAAVMTPEFFPLGEVRGDVVFRGRMERDDLHDMTPDLSLSVVTDHFALAPKTPVERGIDGGWVVSPPPWRVEGVDIDMDANIDGNTGSLNASAKLRDAKGELARVKANSDRPPWSDVLHDGGRLLADLRTTPFQLEVAVPEHGLGSMPAPLRQSYLTGKLQGDLTFSGTLLDPKLQLAAKLHKSHVGMTERLTPLEFELTAEYDGRHGQAALRGLAQERDVIEVGGEFDGAVGDLLNSFASARWRAAAQASFARFPLAAIGPLDDKLISGELNGDVAVDDIHEDARATASLGIDSLRVGSVNYKSARLVAKADGHDLDGSISIDGGDGSATARAHAKASWGGALAPHVDPGQPVEAALSAKNFRIAGLLPFVDSVLDELDGRLDSDAHVKLDPGSRHMEATGGISLTRGAFEAVATGDEFHDIAATLRFSPNGVITLENLTAAATTGRLQATGSALFDGAGLRSARANVVIPDGSPIPLNAGGSEIGNVDGRIEASEVTSGDGHAMNVTVDVSRLRVALPAAQRQAQALGTIANVHFGSHRGHPQAFVLLPLDSTQKKEKREESSGANGPQFAVHAGLRDVTVVRGSDLKIGLKGSLDVKGAGVPEVTGQIHLEPGGYLVVQGRKFKVQNGSVTFLGQDPSNPDVVVKAGWTAPDGTVVYANFAGPLKTGKVTLSSEPALAQQEIVELLAFGAASGKQAQNASATPTSAAIGTVGGQATQPINYALARLGLGALTTKVDTSESSTPKPEVEVQIAKDISLQIAVVLGQPLPGVNPDRTLLTLDWRFLSRWSLSSTLGDAGTAIVDLLWQRRY